MNDPVHRNLPSLLLRPLLARTQAHRRKRLKTVADTAARMGRERLDLGIEAAVADGERAKLVDGKDCKGQPSCKDRRQRTVILEEMKARDKGQG
jgi:hypothetical protein